MDLGQHRVEELPLSGDRGRQNFANVQSFQMPNKTNIKKSAAKWTGIFAK